MTSSKTHAIVAALRQEHEEWLRGIGDTVAPARTPEASV